MLANEVLSGLETQKGWGWFLIQSKVSRSTEEAVSTRDMERKLFITEFMVLGIQ